MRDERFELSDDDGLTWYSATRAEYVAAERQAGFHNSLGKPGEPATSAWSNGKKAGRMAFLEAQQ